MVWNKTRYWNSIKDAKTEEEVWEILENFDLDCYQQCQIVMMFRTSQEVKAKYAIAV